MLWLRDTLDVHNKMDRVLKPQAQSLERGLLVHMDDDLVHVAHL